MLAQEPPGSGAPADIVVTPNRTAQPIQRAGSAITVIPAEEIAKSSVKDVSDLLRQSPGVSLTQAGGPGRVQTVRIRGGDVRHTLVLIDGIRVNDPSSTGREFDFSTLVLADIERIEVLRGPQSALYGSDALGGVINIITKRGGGRPRASLAVEGGSYGTKEVRGGLTGGDDKVDYSIGFSGVETAGFSAYGYRIPRLATVVPWGLEPDAARRLGLTARFGLNVADGVRLEFGGSYSHNRAQFDSAFGSYPDTPSLGTSRLGNVYGRLIADSFGGLLRNTVTVFANRTERESENVSYFGRVPSVSRSDSTFVGERIGAEYQGDLKLGSLGQFTFGARVEREEADGFSRAVLPTLRAQRRDFTAEQTTRSLFALHQITLADRLHLSLGGRIDDVRGVEQFATWRATLAYEIPDTETKLRASVGTGGKAPSLFQLYSEFGTPSLAPEHSWGVDAGIDQSLFEGRVKLSATAFHNRYRNLIDFTGDVSLCQPTQFFGCYYNVARARTRGFELQGDVDVVPGFARLRLAYTHLNAIDLSTGLELARRPRDEGRVALALTPYAGLTLEPRVTFVGERFDLPGQKGKLQPYARFDLYADYKIDETYSVYARGENLTNARFEEVRGYGTTGRAIYAGMRATW
ncbi:MAG TPA: TonB-dependent receptor [Beijerinckiaceae bacterium]